MLEMCAGNKLQALMEKADFNYFPEPKLTQAP